MLSPVSIERSSFDYNVDPLYDLLFLACLIPQYEINSQRITAYILWFIVEDKLKCLSLKQPYAELLISGKKSIELRKWNTNYRGQFLVHASKNVDKKKCESLAIDFNILNRGAILGIAILYDVKKYENRTEFERDRNKHFADSINFADYRYGFIIRSAKRFRKPLPYLGQLKFFEVSLPIRQYQ